MVDEKLIKGHRFFFPSPLTYRTDRAKGRDGEKTTTHAGYKICTIIQPIELQTPIEHHFHLTFFLVGVGDGMEWRGFWDGDIHRKGKTCWIA